jgi:hypothetical protein
LDKTIEPPSNPVRGDTTLGVYITQLVGT